MEIEFIQVRKFRVTAFDKESGDARYEVWSRLLRL